MTSQIDIIISTLHNYSYSACTGGSTIMGVEIIDGCNNFLNIVLTIDGYCVFRVRNNTYAHSTVVWFDLSSRELHQVSLQYDNYSGTGKNIIININSGSTEYNEEDSETMRTDVLLESTIGFGSTGMDVEELSFELGLFGVPNYDVINVINKSELLKAEILKFCQR